MPCTAKMRKSIPPAHVTVRSEMRDASMRPTGRGCGREGGSEGGREGRREGEKRKDSVVIKSNGCGGRV